MKESQYIPTEAQESFRQQEADHSLDQRIVEIREEVAQIVDALGKPIDEGIVDSIVYLKALDIPTTQSCEGHPEGGRPWPWIRIGVENEPRERYVGQLEVYQRIAAENGVEPEAVERALEMELWEQAERELATHPETEAYIEWTHKNKKLMETVQQLLDEFYSMREVAEDVRLEIVPMAGNEAEIMPHEPNSKPALWAELSEQQIAEIVAKLPARQAEMSAFTQFLQQTYHQKNSGQSNYGDNLE